MESGSMHIVCPHCTTSYAINLATLGEAGRTVRCARCKETWLARPEDAIEPAMAEADHSAQRDMAAKWDETGDEAGRTPVVDSPSIAGDWQTENSSDDKEDWVALVRDVSAEEDADLPHGGPLSRLLKRKPREERSRVGRYFANLPMACAAMGALVMALIVWRTDVVRVAPQTAGFYRMVGLNVNLRGLAFRDVKVTTETVEGKKVLVIEGVVVGESKKTVDLPRLRFSVRDAQGAEIYAWNSVLEQTTLSPGEHASFKSRLASPPAEGKSIDVRFFNKRDITGGSV
jgi:predicted Zn finger-like uncharacterized protein